MPIRVQVIGHGIVEFPDGTSEDEMRTALATLDAPGPPAAPKGQTVEGSTFGEKVKNAAKLIPSALPTVGGIVGGIAGGVPGAAVGGAAGEGFKDLAQHATELPGAVVDVARNLVAHPKETATGFAQGALHGTVEAGEEAAGQAVGQVVGNTLAYGGGKLAKWLMNRATSRVTARLMQDFPEMPDTLIDNALSVSEGGYGKARSLLMAAKAKANTALKVADQAGAQIPIVLNEDLAQSLKTALLEKLVKTGKTGAPMGLPLTTATERLDPASKALFQQIDAAANGGTLDLSASQADLLKSQLQRESRALYANRTAPNGQKAMGMDATERGEFASRLNDAIDDLASGYKAANAEAKPLIGATRGIKQAIRPNGNLYQALVRPAVGGIIGEESGRREGGATGAIIGGAAGAYATSPKGMSHAAIALASPAFQGILRALPKPAAQWLLDLVSREAAADQSPEPSR